MSGPRILLVGNGSHDNRGCQAIDVGTVAILARAFGTPTITLMPHGTGEVVLPAAPPGVAVARVQATGGYARSPFQKATWHLSRRLSPAGAVRVLETWFPAVTRAALDADIVLALGGDNLSLDYGRPDVFWALNRAAIAGCRRFYIWGASVGPFGDDAYARFCAAELSRASGVFARERATAETLADLGVQTSLYEVADPAFALEPRRPDPSRMRIPIPEGCVGINLSPLLGKVRRMSAEAWVEEATRMVEHVARRIDRPIVLVPHVIQPGNDDHSFLGEISRRLGTVHQVSVVPPLLEADELKWVLGRLVAFAGARTHATIASLSSLVPTVSIGYSMKARGINEALLGDDRWVIDARTFDGASLTASLKAAITEADGLRRKLATSIPEARALAFAAGDILATEWRASERAGRS